MRRISLIIAATLGLAACSDNNGSEAKAEEGSPSAGVFSLATKEEYLKDASKLVGELMLTINPKLTEAGLKPLTPSDDDICFTGFIQNKPDGEYILYRFDAKRFDADGVVAYVPLRDYGGKCSYDPVNRADTCQAKDGSQLFIKYPKENNFTQQLTFNSRQDLEKVENGTLNEYVSCAAVADKLLAHVDASAAQEDGGGSPGSGILVRAVMDDPKYLEILKTFSK